MYNFEILEKNGAVKVHALNPGETISIGRDGNNNIVIDDPSVSRSHCLLYIGISSVEIEDLDSTNGVHVQGDRILARIQLNPSDELTIGNIVCFLHATDHSVMTEDTIIQPKPESDK